MIWLLLACLDPSCATLTPEDDGLLWTPVENADTCEVYREESPEEPCLTVPGNAGEAQIWGSSCIAPREEAKLYVRCCNSAGCGGSDGPVTFIPYLCIEGSQEVPCWDGAPDRLPNR